MIDQNDALTPFQITYRPAHVVKHMTELVTVRCGHEDKKIQSQLQEISRIRMLKKTGSGWKLLAELRDNEDKPRNNVEADVTAKISSKIEETFIQIVWPLANDETFGIYRCDVIGFDRTSFLSSTEVTDGLDLSEENVTTTDMLDMFIETKDEMHDLEDREDHLEVDFQTLDNKLTTITQQVKRQGNDLVRLGDNVDTVSQSLTKVTNDVTNLKDDVSSLKSDTVTVDENTRKIEYLNTNLETVKAEVASLSPDTTAAHPKTSRFNALMSWPAGMYALLQPKSGCPVDLTFFGGDDRYWQIHTESSSGSVTRNTHSDILSPLTLSSAGGNNFLTLRFCEANGILNTGSWPSGSYCINRFVGIPCPSGFSEGKVQVDEEDTNSIAESSSRSVYSSGQDIAFCCMSSGDSSTAMTLPTTSPFVLYRRGGQCQQVQGMNVAVETVTIDTEDGVNSDGKTGQTPDVDFIKAGSLVKFYLCYYTPA